jgi:hypothetical protein
MVVRLVLKTMHKQKDRLAAVSPKSDQVKVRDFLGAVVQPLCSIADLKYKGIEYENISPSRNDWWPEPACWQLD